jgi:hypothetical protein
MRTREEIEVELEELVDHLEWTEREAGEIRDTIAELEFELADWFGKHEK